MRNWTRYPDPMSARRARFEAERARHHGVILPEGHPYAALPTWVPYWIARLHARLRRGAASRRKPRRSRAY